MERVNGICEDPRVATKLVNNHLYRDRIGKCRIKYSVDEGSRIVDFTEIGIQ